jgi:hypothetical protein
MKNEHYTETPAELYGDLKGVSIRWVIDQDDDAPNFAMRVIEVEPGCNTPYHTHGRSSTSNPTSRTGSSIRGTTSCASSASSPTSRRADKLYPSSSGVTRDSSVARSIMPLWRYTISPSGSMTSVTGRPVIW